MEILMIINADDGTIKADWAWGRNCWGWLLLVVELLKATATYGRIGVCVGNVEDNWNFLWNC